MGRGTGEEGGDIGGEGAKPGAPLLFDALWRQNKTKDRSSIRGDRVQNRVLLNTRGENTINGMYSEV